MYVRHSSRLQRALRRGNCHVLRIAFAVAEAWKADHTENCIPNGKALHTVSHLFNDAGDVCAQDDGERYDRTPLGRKHLAAISQIQIRRIDPCGVPTEKPLTGLQLRPWRILVLKTLRSTIF